jgi:hypothetical protein
MSMCSSDLNDQHQRNPHGVPGFAGFVIGALGFLALIWKRYSRGGMPAAPALRMMSTFPGMTSDFVVYPAVGYDVHVTSLGKMLRRFLVDQM